MKQILATLLLLPLAAGAAEHRIEHREALAWRAGSEITIENLAGEVTLVRGEGDQVVIEAVVIANARRAADAEALARSVTLQRDGDRVWVEYPTDAHSTFIYSGLRGNSTTNTSYRGERVTVTSRDRDGVEVHADIRVTVPAGAKLDVRNTVGRIGAEGIGGELALATASGRIETANGQGALALRSGSGSLKVTGHDGAVDGRAGSGSIEVSGVNGDVNMRAGSGSIKLERVAGTTHVLRTGSGSVRVADISGSLNVGSGSGSVRIGNLSAVTELEVTTGSGTIRANGDLGAVTVMRMRAGSGSINVHSTTVPNVAIRASAGSGSVSVDAPGVRIISERRNRIEAVLGDGSGEATFSSGSGSINFRAGR